MAEVTYYDYINAFYELLKVNPPSSSAQLLYHTLLMEYNNAHWQSVELQRTNAYIARLCSISEKSLIKAKNELKQLGLIDFKSAKKQSTIYFLTVKSTVKKEVKSAVKREVKTQYKRQEKVQAYKDKRDKIKDIDNTTPIVPLVVVPQNVIETYENNIAPLTPIVRDAIANWLNDIEEDMLIWAIGEAVAHNKRTWKYIEGILRNHFNAGRTTLTQVKDAQRSFRNNGAELSINNDSGLDYAELEKIMQEKM